MSSANEAAFEDHIVGWLVEHGGYQHAKVGNTGVGVPDFDAEAGIDTADLFAFIGATQGDVWQRLVDAGYGGDVGTTQSGFVKRLASELNKRGTVDVLRQGVVDRGVTIQLAFFKPAHGLTAELAECYEANILTVTRQLPFNPKTAQTIDLGLFVNGIPVATAELKNPLTGQNVENAIEQYRKDRDPKNQTLARVGMVHFAVDPFSVAMTTRLAGNRTRFLPFNQGCDLGPGNPPNPDGHNTAYLWERVWSRDAWMDILGRFIHVEKPSKGSKARPLVIFPRYHQWDAVKKLVADAKTTGAGKSYLVQHSAGSGKSNTIAWLAHRLSSLHNDADEKIFDKVVVITDRVILDRQLQETISQFERVIGVVQRIDESSAQLADALAGEQARIIITTLQKFPFIFDKIGDLPGRKYAVIVDEAHSSQTGEAAKELRRALGSAAVDGAADSAAGVDADEEAIDVGGLLAEAVAARGRQPNLSFFAFTATPKGRTLELFGTLNDEGKHQPFHLYSMRQAIEEGFIEDVLANYTTYDQYFHLEKSILSDPEYDTAKARRAIARFVTLHPDNLAQKAEIIVEHFRTNIAHHMAGNAKAMVVCSSRLHAVRMRDALCEHVKQMGYKLGVLVAFSGEIDGQTESKANGFPESQTAERFDTADWQIMVVAEKFQTGFDQPKLVAMYVDKPLTGLAAVQTLSRLNRIDPDKTGTFVLDFRNDSDLIREEFAVYHGKTVAPPTDPNLLFDTRRALDDFGVLDPGEMERAAALLATKGQPDDGAHEQIYAALQPAVDRFSALEEEDQEAFREELARFVRVYGFLAQIVPFANVELERDYLYCRALASLVRDGRPGQSIDIGSVVELTHLRHEKTFEGSIPLPGGEGEVITIFSGTGRQRDPDEEALSEIIERLNERFGTTWTDEDRLVFDAAASDLIADDELQNQAINNDEATFREHVFPGRYDKALLSRHDRNSDLIHTYLDNEELRDEIMKVLAGAVQKRATVARQRICPIGELLGEDLQSPYLEYTLELSEDVVATVAGFANASYGGTLLVGVNDDGLVAGINDRQETWSKRLSDLLRTRLGDAVQAFVSWEFHTIEGNDLARISIAAAAFPIYERKEGENDRGIFWQRKALPKTALSKTEAPSTTEITDARELERFIVRRWRDA